MDSTLVYPNPDNESKFIAYHLDTGARLQGDSPTEALEKCRAWLPTARKILEETAEEVGEPPETNHHRAPDEFYETFRAIVEGGEPTTLERTHDFWAVRGDKVMGLDLIHHPGLVLSLQGYNPDDYLF